MDEYKRAYDFVSKQEPKFHAGYLISYLRTQGKTSFLAVNTMCTRIDGKNEIRKEFPVGTIPVKAHYRLLNYEVSTIDNVEGLTLFLRNGGHSVIEENLVASHWNELLTAKIVAKIHPNGFNSYLEIEDKYKQRFAKGAKRMDIMSRDQFQCRLCGSSPDDNIHVRLEVHHIKPWEEGGLTIPENLITLCKTCHDGIGLADRQLLYRKVGIALDRRKGSIFPVNQLWSKAQLTSYSYLLSNAVTFEVKNEVNGK